MAIIKEFWDDFNSKFMLASILFHQMVLIGLLIYEFCYERYSDDRPKKCFVKEHCLTWKDYVDRKTKEEDQIEQNKKIQLEEDKTEESKRIQNEESQIEENKKNQLLKPESAEKSPAKLIQGRHHSMFNNETTSVKDKKAMFANTQGSRSRIFTDNSQKSEEKNKKCKTEQLKEKMMIREEKKYNKKMEEYQTKYHKIDTIKAEEIKLVKQQENDRLQERRKLEVIYIPETGDLDYYSIEDRIKYHFIQHVMTLSYCFATPAHNHVIVAMTFSHLIFFILHTLVAYMRKVKISRFIENFMNILNFGMIIICVYDKSLQKSKLNWFDALQEKA